jgi:hypothetical protein
MISDGCTDTNIARFGSKRIGENLLPTAQAWKLGAAGPSSGVGSSNGN